MARSIHLTHTWVLGDLIDSGGDGRVYRAGTDGYPDSAAKLIDKFPGSARELLFADNLDGVRNIVPIVDFGETDDSYVLVMPRAKMSLKDHMEMLDGPLEVDDAAVILVDILESLVDLDGRVVHRDLKPGNVLLLNDRWCLSDFGTSRYAEAATASATRKYSFTDQYGAPEQWRYEKSTIATDVYAVGVIAYELLAGTRPFVGPSSSDFREQHLFGDPPKLPGVPPTIASLVDECLLKSPEARPRPANLLARLSILDRTLAPSRGLAKLQRANQAEVSRRGERARLESEWRSQNERLDQLFDAAQRSASRIFGGLKESILEMAPSVTFSPTGKTAWRLRLNYAELEFRGTIRAGHPYWARAENAPFRVVAFTSLDVQVDRNAPGYSGRSHSFWYCDAQSENEFHWYETAFMYAPTSRQSNSAAPFALEPSDVAIDAVGSGMASCQLARPFVQVSAESMADFIDRWGGWFADAADGSLDGPLGLPEGEPKGSYRTK